VVYIDKKKTYVSLMTKLYLYERFRVSALTVAVYVRVNHWGW